MQKNNKNSILIISHQERILDIADEIVLLADGVIKAHGSKEEILPVSYTHLDVYKRQVFNGSPERNFACFR